MTNFNISLKKTLKHEGGYTTDPNETIFGVDRKHNPNWPGWKIVDSIKGPTTTNYYINHFCKMSNALYKCTYDLYYKKYYRRYKIQYIQSQKIADVVFDTIVNCGPKRGIIILQRAFNMFYRDFLKVDGIIGPKTLHAINNLNKDKNEFVKNYCMVRIRFYFDLAEKKRYRKFLKGWIRRAADYVY